MGRMLSSLLREVSNIGSDRGQTLAYYCVGCESPHHIEVEKRNQWGAKWTWDGEVMRPTISPSVNVAPNYPEFRCHHFISEGKIQYLSDSHHKYAGQTVPMVPYDQGMRGDHDSTGD